MEEYRERSDLEVASVNRMMSRDPAIKKLKDRWGADVVLVAITGDERISPPGKSGVCGLASAGAFGRVRGQLNRVAAAKVTESGFCSELFTATHELTHLFRAKHPTEPHEEPVEDREYPWRFSMMGYRNDDCADIKPQCLRTLSYIPSVLDVIDEHREQLAEINDAIRWR